MMRVIKQFEPEATELNTQWKSMVSMLPDNSPMFALSSDDLFEQWSNLAEGAQLEILQKKAKNIEPKIKVKLFKRIINFFNEQILQTGMDSSD